MWRGNVEAVAEADAMAKLTKEQILERIQALPKKSKYLSREEINQRINLACELGLFTKNPLGLKNAVRS